jgi:hypothetical protein
MLLDDDLDDRTRQAIVATAFLQACALLEHDPEGVGEVLVDEWDSIRLSGGTSYGWAAAVR